MTLVIPPGFGNCALTFTGPVGTQPFVTTIGVDTSSVGGDFVLAANQVMTAYADAMKAVTNSSLTLDRCTMAVGQDGAGGSVDSDIAPIPMTGSGTFGPMAMAVIGRKVTNEFGRRGRGRMFLPGVNLESGIEPDGSLTSTYRTTIVTALGNFWDFLSDPELVNLPPVLFHSVAPTEPTPITNLIPSDLVGWVRGRIR